ncbi:MAG: DUF4281 domain-containing protein [Pseudomonadales bacterium]|nr:DUF4281 domain-containing protein [Pseudomonadales bacterium]
MTPDTVFTIINAAILPFWVLLLFLPHHKVTQVLVHSGLVPVLFGLVYAYYMISGLILGGAEGGGMDSLQSLMMAFTDPGSVVAAWTHYLIFDLFVGAWMVRDAKREEILHLAIVIPLVLTLMAGPVGLLLYVALKGAMRRKFGFLETG